MNTLSISGLSLWYGNYQALKDITLPAIHSGEVVGLIGPNAAGKSTLLKTILWPGKAKQDISYKSQNISILSRKDRSKIFGLMPQAPPQPSSLTPYELLWSLARALGLPLSDDALRSRMQKLFERFGLVTDALQPLNTLSGGKRQLVGTVMLLLRSPQICLLDEPTSALDLHWRHIVLDEIRDLIIQEEKIAFIALHDLNLAIKYCDKLILLHEGKIVASGIPLDVLTTENLAKVYKVEAQIHRNIPERPRIEIIGPIKPTV